MNIAKSMLAVAGLVAAFAATGCGYIMSTAPGHTNLTGEAWYVKNTGLNPHLVWSSKVFYCDSTGKVCKEAKMVEKE